MSTASAQGVTKDEPEVHPELLSHVDNMIGAVRNGDAQRLANSLKGIHDHFNALQDETENPEANGDSKP